MKFEEVSHEMLVLMLQHVSSRVAGFCGAVAVSMGEAAKPILLNVSKQAVISFCVAGVALRGIPTCFMMCQKSFCVARAILVLHFQKMRCIFRGGCSTFDTPDVILRGRRSTLDVSCCVFFANGIVSAARSGDKVLIVDAQLASRMYKVFGPMKTAAHPFAKQLNTLAFQI